jgi:hypothetical protein
MDKFLCMAFAQLTYRESLRYIEACLRAMQSKLYNMGISELTFLPNESMLKDDGYGTVDNSHPNDLGMMR